MKKFSKIVLILIMLTLCICVVTSCDKDNGTQVTGITISEGNMPQTVFVKGNELDLSAGKLTVATGKGQSEIALNAEGVSVSGYDKNTAGQQTLTITYNGVSTNLTVNVVERFVAENNVTKEYVVGESFDNAGRLTVTKDDGTTFTASIRDQKITVTEFDSSTAGEKNVSLVYTDSEVEYTGSFPVTVYEVESVRLVPPNKLFYNSHDTELDLSGGYFVVKANGGKLQKSVLLDGNAVTGFDPDAVSEEEPTIQQTVHVDYSGFDTTYKVTITLTDVTRVKKAAAAIKDQSVTQEVGERALNALNIMNSLSESDLAFVTAEEQNTILFSAATWGKSVWNDVIANYQIFDIQDSYLLMNCDNLDEVRTQYASLSALEEDNPMFAYGDILYKALETHYQDIYSGETTYGEYLSNVCAGTTIKNSIAQLGFMLQMHDTLSAIPQGTIASDLMLPENAAIIEETHGYLVEMGKISSPISDRYLFDTISAWRDPQNDEFYDILYRYYYTLYKNADETISQKGVAGIEDMIDLRMPGILEVFYSQLLNTMFEQFDLSYSMSQDGAMIQPAGSMDTLGFVINYRELEKLNQEIMNNDDEMILTLYEVYGIGERLINLQTGDFGYLQVKGAASGVAEFEAVWDKYIDVISSVGDVSEHFTPEIGAKVEDLFKSFVALTPELQAQFVASLNPYGSIEFFPTDGTDRMPMFSQLFVVYYSDVLPENFLVLNENEDGIVFLMLGALQYYMFRDQKIDDTTTYMNVFLDTMKSVDELYNALTTDEKALFDSHIGFMYDELKSVSAFYDENGKFIEKQLPEEWQKQITTLRDLYQILSTMMVNSMQDYTLYPVFISLYENAVDVYDDIIANAPQDVKDYVLHNITDVFSDINATLETDLYLFRNVYISYLSSYPYDEQSMLMVWNEYQNSNIRQYFASLLDFYAASIVDMNELTLEMVQNAMAGFRSLTDDEKALFVAMDGDGTFIYFQALHAYFARMIFADSSANSVLADALIQLEIDSVSKFVDESEYVAAWEAIASQYANLTEAEKEAFDTNLLDAYNYYKNIYDEIKASQGDQSAQ